MLAKLFYDFLTGVMNSGGNKQCFQFWCLDCKLQVIELVLCKKNGSKWEGVEVNLERVLKTGSWPIPVYQPVIDGFQNPGNKGFTHCHSVLPMMHWFHLLLQTHDTSGYFRSPPATHLPNKKENFNKKHMIAFSVVYLLVLQTYGGINCLYRWTRQRAIMNIFCCHQHVKLF